MDNNNKEVTPREFKVGDVVWDSIRYGKGEVTDTDNTEPKIMVEFKADTEWFFSDGRLAENDVIKRLQHQPYKIELLEIPEELPEVGTPVYVWDNTDKACTIEFYSNKVGKKYITKTTTPPVGDAGSSWDNMSLTLPDKFK
jgi:hypothetical protein